MINLKKIKINSLDIKYILINFLIIILILIVYRTDNKILENTKYVKDDYSIVENYSHMEIDLEYEKHEILNNIKKFDKKLISNQIPNSFINQFNPDKSFNYNLNIIEIEKPMEMGDLESYINLEINGDLDDNLDFFEKMEKGYLNLSIDTIEINKEVFGENYYKFDTRFLLYNLGDNNE